MEKYIVFSDLLFCKYKCLDKTSLFIKKTVDLKYKRLIGVQSCIVLEATMTFFAFLVFTSGLNNLDFKHQFSILSNEVVLDPLRIVHVESLNTRPFFIC